MENKLKMLFDFQRFEDNDRLSRLINDTESRFGRALSDDDLFMVNAAGEGGNAFCGIMLNNNGQDK